MASFKGWILFAISSSIFSINIECLNAQVLTNGNQSNTLTPAQQILSDMRQSNAPALGGSSMQILRFTGNNLSFAPLEGLDRLFNWQISRDGGFASDKTMGDRVEQFKLAQRQQIVSDSKVLEVINRINRK